MTDPTNPQAIPRMATGAIPIIRPSQPVRRESVTLELLAQADAEDRAFIRDNKERQHRMLQSPLLRSISL